MKLLNHLLTILSIISFVILVKSTITFVEEVQNPGVYDLKCYDDDTIVAHMYFINNENNSDPNFDCIEKNLSLRTIYPNGSVNSVDIPMDKSYIPPVNFCLNKPNDLHY